MRAEGRKAGIWKPQQQKRYNITTICFSLHHLENMHCRYLLESTLRFPVEGEKTETTLGKGRSPAMVRLWRWLQHVSWRALELEWTFSIVADCASPLRMSKLWEMVKDQEAWPAAVHGFTKSQTWLSNWTAMNNNN